MAGIKRDSSGDLDFSEGFKLVRGSEELAQRISLGVTINLGEFFMYNNHGLPWLKDKNNIISPDIQYFLGEGDQVSAQYVVKTIDNYIETIDQVASVSSTYEFNRSNRELRYLPIITGIDGEVINFPPFVQQI